MSWLSALTSPREMRRESDPSVPQAQPAFNVLELKKPTRKLPGLEPARDPACLLSR